MFSSEYQVRNLTCIIKTFNFKQSSKFIGEKNAQYFMTGSYRLTLQDIKNTLRRLVILVQVPIESYTLKFCNRQYDSTQSAGLYMNQNFSSIMEREFYKHIGNTNYPRQSNFPEMSNIKQLLSSNYQIVRSNLLKRYQMLVIQKRMAILISYFSTL